MAPYPAEDVRQLADDHRRVHVLVDLPPRSPRETCPMPRVFSRVLAAVLGAAVLALVVGTSAVALGRYGNDISWPQCGGAFPAQAGFGIIGVNGGRPFTQNPCLAAEWQWALSNRGAPAYYMNISNPGTADPSGYGASAAAYALNYASSATGASSAVNHVWWLDVETANT